MIELERPRSYGLHQTERPLPIAQQMLVVRPGT